MSGNKKNSGRRPLFADIRLSGGLHKQRFHLEGQVIGQKQLEDAFNQVKGIVVHKNCRSGGENECDYVVYADQATGPSSSAIQAAGEDAEAVPL
jgi:hypothetical protein